MKTVTINEVMYTAGELAGRTRDKLPLTEAVMLRAFIGEDLEELWESHAWPELVNGPTVKTVTSRLISKGEGTANEMGEILGVYTADPTTTTRYREVEWDEIEGYIRIHETLTTVYVEWLTKAPDVLSITTAAVGALEIPRRFRSYLAYRAAGLLLRADGQSGSGNEWLLLAETALQRQLSRLPPTPPWRRGIRTRKAVTTTDD